MPDYVFPVHSADAFLASLPYRFNIGPGFREWEAGDGVTRFTVEQIRKHLPDGRLVHDVVSVAHHSDLLQPFSAAFLADLNRLAPLGAFIPAQPELPPRFVMKTGVFAGDEAAAERVYAPLLCMQAAFMHWHVAKIVRGQFECDPELSPLERVNDPAPYSQADYESVKERMDGHRFYGTLGSLYYTCEFPWDDGAVSNVFGLDDARAQLEARGVSSEAIEAAGGRTSLFQIQNMRHPLYGNGVQARLEIPLSAEHEEAARVATELKIWELDTPDLPPLFGAWCVGPRSPAFVTFVPNQLCLPGLLHNLAVWAMVRHFRVRRWVESTPAGMQ